MEKVISIAAYIVRRYLIEFQNTIDEMKLHKLLYFAQRESLIERGEPLFLEPFQAWRLGPVMVCVREKFASLNAIETPDYGALYPNVFTRLFSHYAVKSSVSLSDLSHGEYSWRHAREGLGPYDQCSNELLLEDIRLDAERIKKRRLIIKRIA